MQVHKDICWVEEPEIKIPYAHTTINQPGKQLTNHITPHKEKKREKHTQPSSRQEITVQSQGRPSTTEGGCTALPQRRPKTNGGRDFHWSL